MTDPEDLRQLELFSGCTPSELAAAARLLTVVDAPAGRELTVQGGLARQFVLVESGEVEVTHRRLGGPDRVVCIGAGSWVGEIGLLDHAPCNATVRVLTPARLHVATAREFYSLCAIGAIADRLRSTADDRVIENRMADALC